MCPPHPQNPIEEINEHILGPFTCKHIGLIHFIDLTEEKIFPAENIKKKNNQTKKKNFSLRVSAYEKASPL